MQYRYAQIYKGKDGYGYVEADSFLSGVIEMDTMIPVAEGFDLTGKRWNYEKKRWEKYVKEDIEYVDDVKGTNNVNISFLDKLVNSGKITEEEKNKILGIEQKESKLPSMSEEDW